MKTVKPGDRLIANIHEADFEPWVFDNGESDPDSGVLQLNPNKSKGIGFHVYKMEPGCITTPHEHSADEEFLLLSGDVHDNDGTEYRVGDLVWMRKGTQHSSTTKNGCILAVYIESREEALD